MSSEVKLIVQSDVRVEENGNFTLNFASDYLEGKRELFLSQNDEFFINSFHVNIDTNDVNHTSYDQTPSENQIDLTTGELKYVNENVQKSKEILGRQTESVKNAEKSLDNINHKEWKEITPYLLNFHMIYKESVFELEEFDISTKYTLKLVTRDNSKLSYKDKVQNTLDYSKYSFAIYSFNYFISTTTAVN